MNDTFATQFIKNHLAFITLTSDYGQGSHYVAALKGTLYSLLPDVTVTDISHTIKAHDILQTAFVLKNSASYFPAGTVHLICVDTSFNLHGQYIIAEMNGHYFIGADNGIFSLLPDAAVNMYVVNADQVDPNDLFPDKNQFARLAARIIKGENIMQFAQPGQAQNIKQHIAPVVEEDLIRGNIVFIDGYDNAITNISRELFTQKMSNKSRFAIFYRRREKITYISRNYHDVKGGGELALFNESGMLELAMNNGRAGQLLGLQVGGPVIIEFYD